MCFVSLAKKRILLLFVQTRYCIISRVFQCLEISQISHLLDVIGGSDVLPVGCDEVSQREVALQRFEFVVLNKTFT